MRLAAIDVGTNSIHTVIVEVTEDLNITILDRVKDTVQLGRGRDDRGNLTVRAMTDALTALRKAKVLCQRQEVEKTLAVATSAIREAPNGLEFLRLVEKDTGIAVRVITGVEEARLIYLAVRESIHLNDKPFLATDIGGGSVEFIWGTRRELLASESLKVGALRLADRFPLSDPATKRELTALRNYVDSQLRRLDRLADAHPFDRVIGTSGTIHQLCRLASDGTALRSSSSLHQQVVPARTLRDVCELLVRSTVQERLSMKGLDRTRIHSIVPGAAVFGAILDRFDIDAVIVCEYALREGVLYDYVERNRAGLRQERTLPDIQLRSVLGLGRRCNWDETHARHVAGLSLQIFDQLYSELGWDSQERTLLEYAALLHDIGMLISVQKHHRHSQYLIEHAELLGFTPREIALMGNIVRYHRRAKPKKKHESFRALDKKDRKIVCRLAGVLRIAEALDRTRFQLIREVHCEVHDVVLITAMAEGDAAVEATLAGERTDLLSSAIARKVEIQLGDAQLMAEGLVPSAARRGHHPQAAPTHESPGRAE